MIRRDAAVAGSSHVVSSFEHDKAASDCMGSVDMLTNFSSRGVLKKDFALFHELFSMSTAQTVSKILMY